MHYRWRVPTSLEVCRARPAARYLVTAAGGYFPIVVRQPDGRLAAVAREGDFHVGQRGWLGLLVSDDGGESWSEPKRIAHGAQDPCHVAFGCTRSGTLLVGYVLPHVYTDGPWNLSVMPLGPIYLIRSDDGGRTWSEAAQLDASSIPAPSLSPYGRIVQLPDGTLLMDIYVAWPKEGATLAWDTPLGRTYGTYLLRSRDDGMTWGDASLISRAEHNETAVACLPSGKLLAAMRRHNPQDGDDVWMTGSSDGGYSWSTPERVTEHYQHPCDLIHLADGRLLLVFGHRQVPFGVRALVSHDEGKTWDYDHRIILASESISGDCGYPSAVQLDDGHVVVVYYVYHSPGPFVHPGLNQMAGPYAAAIKFRAADLP